MAERRQLRAISTDADIVKVYRQSLYEPQKREGPGDFYMVSTTKETRVTCALTSLFMMNVTRYELAAASVSVDATTRGYTLWLLGNGKRLVTA